MPPPISDTDPEALRVQLDLLRQMGPERRLALALSLSAAVANLAHRAALEACDGDERRARVLFVAAHYGPELAEGFRRRLATEAEEATWPTSSQP